MFADFQHRYAELTEEELLRVASDRLALSDDARSALDSEMRTRSLTAADLTRFNDEVKRSDRHETRRRNKKLFGERRGLVDWSRFALWTFLLISIAALIALWLAK